MHPVDRVGRVRSSDRGVGDRRSPGRSSRTQAGALAGRENLPGLRRGVSGTPRAAGSRSRRDDRIACNTANVGDDRGPGHDRSDLASAPRQRRRARNPAGLPRLDGVSRRDRPAGLLRTPGRASWSDLQIQPVRPAGGLRDGHAPGAGVAPASASASGRCQAPLRRPRPGGRVALHERRRSSRDRKALPIQHRGHRPRTDRGHRTFRLSRGVVRPRA